ncbi:hypothetical protein [Vreelandella sp. EE27]
MTKNTKERSKQVWPGWLYHKITNDWIFGEAILISSGFILAYAVNFHGHSLSSKTSDWADFATYLSGTVGVTAIVATLIVLIRTLGQQEKLIKSQDKMLKKQEKQIKVSKEQLKQEKKRRDIELAHNSAVKIFPTLIERFKSELNSYLTIYEDEFDVYQEIEESIDRFDGKVDDFFFNSMELYDVFDMHDPKIASDIVNRMFSSVGMVYFFAVSHLKVTQDLTEFFYVYMHEDITAISKCYEYLTCYHAFLLGKGEKRLANLGTKYLGFPVSYEDSAIYYSNWFRIGELVSNYDD